MQPGNYFPNRAAAFSGREQRRRNPNADVSPQPIDVSDVRLSGSDRYDFHDHHSATSPNDDKAVRDIRRERTEFAQPRFSGDSRNDSGRNQNIARQLEKGMLRGESSWIRDRGTRILGVEGSQQVRGMSSNFLNPVGVTSDVRDRDALVDGVGAPGGTGNVGEGSIGRDHSTKSETVTSKNHNDDNSQKSKNDRNPRDLVSIATEFFPRDLSAKEKQEEKRQQKQDQSQESQEYYNFLRHRHETKKTYDLDNRYRPRNGEGARFRDSNVNNSINSRPLPPYDRSAEDPYDEAAGSPSFLTPNSMQYTDYDGSDVPAPLALNSLRNDVDSRSDWLRRENLDEIEFGSTLAARASADEIGRQRRIHTVKFDPEVVEQRVQEKYPGDFAETGFPATGFPANNKPEASAAPLTAASLLESLNPDVHVGEIKGRNRTRNYLHTNQNQDPGSRAFFGEADRSPASWDPNRKKAAASPIWEEDVRYSDSMRKQEVGLHSSHSDLSPQKSLRRLLPGGATTQQKSSLSPEKDANVEANNGDGTLKLKNKRSDSK